MRHRAFTIVELLVATGVTMVLAGILLPALGAAREQASRVRCASNLRQVTTAIIAYAHDNRGKLPGVATSPQREWDWIYWAESSDPAFHFGDGPLLRYLSHSGPSVFRCPSDVVSAHARQFNGDTYAYSYGINVYIADAPLSCCSSRGCRLTDVRGSSDKVLMTEPDEARICDGLWLPPAWVEDSDHLTRRHDRRERVVPRRRSNVAFLDGHVQFVTAAYAEDPSRLTAYANSTTALKAFRNHFIR